MPEGDPQASTAIEDPIRALEQEIADDLGIEGFDPDATIGGEDEGDDSTDTSDDTSTASGDEGDEVQESEPDAQNTEDEDESGGDDEEGEKTFTQADVDAAVAERVEQSRRDILANLEDREAKAKAAEEELKRQQAFDAMTPEKQGEYLRNKENRDRMVAELLPEAQERVLANLQQNLGPQFITGFGYNSDPKEWPDSTKEKYSNEQPDGLVAHVLFLHNDSIETQEARINDEWETKWKAREKELRDEFGVSMTESRGAEDRANESEPRVSVNGSPTGGDFLAAELAVAAGTATAEQEALYHKRMYARS
tara:strand:+ start:3240 stop:4166 length:927 start_codon:yes stop_codon:yes gene_type:complete